MKTLSITIDDALSWRDQVNEVSLKLSRQIACLRQIKSCLDIKSRLLFYNSYFLPAINYCNVVWGCCGKGLTDRIFKLQKRILRMIYDDYVSNVDFLLKRAGTLSVYQRIDYDTVILVFKCIYGNVPMYLSNMFIEKPQTRYSLRNNNSFGSTEAKDKSF